MQIDEKLAFHFCTIHWILCSFVLLLLIISTLFPFWAEIYFILFLFFFFFCFLSKRSCNFARAFFIITEEILKAHVKGEEGFWWRGCGLKVFLFSCGFVGFFARVEAIKERHGIKIHVSHQIVLPIADHLHTHKTCDDGSIKCVLKIAIYIKYIQRHATVHPNIDELTFDDAIIEWVHIVSSRHHLLSYLVGR